MKQAQKGKILEIEIFICIVIIILIAVSIGIFGNQLLKIGTYINGIDCSFLNISNASEKLTKTMNNSVITLIFAEDKSYTCLGAFFEFELESKNALNDIILKQSLGENENYTYKIENLYKINEENLKEYLSSLSVFKESNMKEPENAYLEYDEEAKKMVIKPEKYGNTIKLDEAINYMITALKNGETTINFTGITDITPEIVSTDEKLKAAQEEINNILSTKITYKLYNDETYALDSDTMKDWVVKNDDGYYSIDLDNNVTNFVDELNKKARYLLTSTEFNATDLGKINISFGRKTYVELNKEEEIKRIKEQLGDGKEHTFDAIYNSLPNYTNIDTYVELDLTRQRVWMYVDGNCIVNTPCVTGNVAGGYSTPVGIYHLTYKTTDTYLEGYNSDGSKYKSHVNFWMPFNGGIGFHDAAWRSRFGGTIYLTNGSHGCVNLPYSAAKTLYNNINTSMPIILYAS